MQTKVVEPSGTATFIGSDTSLVDLAGSTWTRTGRSQLVRHEGTPARWQPPIIFDREAFRNGDAWTDPTDKRDLPVRAAARIPLVADEWRITHADIARLEAALDRCRTEDVLQRLAARYGLVIGASRWQEVPAPPRS